MSKKEFDYYQISQKLLLKNSKDEVLMLKALPKDTYAGFYDFPGGRINTDEFTIPLPEVLQREVREEIGDVQYTLNTAPVAVGRHLIPANISRSGRDTHVLYLLYEGEYQSGEVTISHEHTGMKWVDLTKEDPEKLLSSGNLEVLQMYLGRWGNRVKITL
ncbi:MAG: NUDIX hydrolase [Patescibacteria group bacterium]